MTRTQSALVFVLSVTALTVSVAPAGAAASSPPTPGVDFIDPARPHCVTPLFSASDIESGRDTRMREASCFPTFADAMESLGAINVAADATPASMSITSFPYQAIAVHCDGPSSGPCTAPWATLTINGTECNGGGLIFSSTWDDRVDENQHKKCNRIRLYATEAYTGSCDTTGPFNSLRTPCRSLINSNEAARYYGPDN